MTITNVLLESCRRQDPRALSMLYRQCYSPLLGICLRYARDYEEGVHFMSISFTHLVLQIDKYDPTFPFEQWMRKLAVNKMLDEIKKMKRLNQKELLHEDYEAFANQLIGVEEVQQLDYDHLLGLIRQLPTVSGTVFNLYVIDGYKHREIAEMLNISENTSRWHLAQARKLLQASIKETERIRL